MKQIKKKSEPKKNCTMLEDNQNLEANAMFTPFTCSVGERNNTTMFSWVKT